MENKTEESANNNLQNLFIKILKRLSLVVVSYIFGRMDWSILWICAPTIFLVYQEYEKELRIQKREIIRALSNEKDVILKYFKELPAWVHFPDTEKVEWLNKIMKQTWPMINRYSKELLEGPIQESLAVSLKGFHFERISLGNVPLRIGGIKVYDNTARDEILMDLDITYAGDCDITFSSTGLTAGIKHFQLYGKLRVILKPIIASVPFFGGIEAFFINNPDVDFDLNGIAQLLDLPGIRSLVEKTITSCIGAYVVLPNKYFIKLSDSIDNEALQTTFPEGVLRVHVVEAKDLMKKDINMLGRGSSDPYAVLTVGSQTYKTKTIDNNINPQWDEWFEFKVFQSRTQILRVSLWDKDQMKDESLGDIKIRLADIVESSKTDKWFQLEHAKTGLVYLRFFWFELSSDSSNLQTVLDEIQALQVPSLHSSILTIFVDSAENLPQIKPTSNPNPQVEVLLGSQSRKTNIISKERNPVFEESFTFFVKNPISDFVEFKVTDTKSNQSLGEHKYSLKTLLNYPELKISKQPLTLFLKNTEENVVLKCSLCLKIMKKDEELNEPENQPLDNGLDDETEELIVKEDLINEAPVEEYPTIQSNEEEISSSTNSLSTTKRIKLTIRYNEYRQKLIITVHQLENTIVKDNDKVYVKLYLLPEGKDSKRKTQYQNGSNPIFDETLEYTLSKIDLDSNIKQVKVIVSIDKVMKNEVLGQAIVDLGSDLLNASQCTWFELSK